MFFLDDAATLFLVGEGANGIWWRRGLRDGRAFSLSWLGLDMLFFELWPATYPERSVCGMYKISIGWKL